MITRVQLTKDSIERLVVPFAMSVSFSTTSKIGRLLDPHFSLVALSCDHKSVTESHVKELFTKKWGIVIPQKSSRRRGKN